MNLIINGLTYSMPNCWQEVNVETFQKLNLIDKTQDEIDLTLNIISTVSGIPFDQLEDIPATEYYKLKNVLKYLETDVKRDLKYRFTLDGIEYGLSHDVSKMTAREYLDADVITKNHETIVDNLHLLLGVLYRPIIKITNPNDKLGFKLEPYRTEDLEDRAKLFKKAPIDIAMSLLFFFGIYATELSGCIAVYSSKIIKPKTKKKRQTKKK